MKFLIARWDNWNPEAAGAGPPDSVRWSDGTSATIADYHHHIDDTHRVVLASSKCCEKHYSPDITVDVRFDPKGGHWSVSGKGVEPIALCLNDPFACDDKIAEEMYGLPTVYQYRIHRPAGSAVVQ